LKNASAFTKAENEFKAKQAELFTKIERYELDKFGNLKVKFDEIFFLKN